MALEIVYDGVNPEPIAIEGAALEPITPAAYYLAKVTWEDRIPLEPRLRLLAKMKLAAAFDESWLEPTATEEQQQLLPFIPGFNSYDKSGDVNVLDPRIAQLLGGLQMVYGIFGDQAAFETAMATISFPGPLPGEPVR